jgi:hypothetical protein
VIDCFDVDFKEEDLGKSEAAKPMAYRKQHRALLPGVHGRQANDVAQHEVRIGQARLKQ